MKICQILYSGLGGHGNVVFSLIDGDKEHLTNNYLIFYGIEDVKKEYEENCKKLQLPYSVIVKKRGSNLRSWKQVFNKLIQQKPDVILLHSITLVVVGICYKIIHYKTKLIVIEHNANQIKRRSEWLWSFLSLALSNWVIYLSDTYKNEIKKKFSFFSFKNTQIISNGINLDVYSPEKNKTELDFTITMIGRFTQFRDHDTLINACNKCLKKIPNLKLILAGDGETFEDIKKGTLNKNLKSFIQFTGTLNEKEILNLLHSTTVYVHSSLAETMSTSIMQAMAVGLPIISTNISGIRNMLTDNQTALLFEPQNVDQLSKLILQLHSNYELRENISINARLYAENKFSNETMFSLYYNLMKT